MIEIVVLDRQRARRVAKAPLRRFLRALAAAEPASAARSLGVGLVSDRRMRALNRSFRGIDRTTDVLAFPDGADGHLGDLVVSIPTAAAQARAARHSLAREIRILLIHGYLHLLGFDHETDGGRMLRRQARLVRRLAGTRTSR